MRSYVIVLLIELLLSCPYAAFCAETKAASASRPEELLNLFNTLANINSIQDSKAGDRTAFPDNVKFCREPISAYSHSGAYYGLRRKAWMGKYDTYDPTSPFARDMAASAGQLAATTDSLIRGGFVNAVMSTGLQPAIMFDIDNTLAFTGDFDDDLEGDAPPIEATVAYVQKYCFQGGIECFFITARDCTSTSSAATLKWMKNKLKMDEQTILSHTFITGNLKSCDTFPLNRIAYKDLLRKRLAKTRKIFWLFSVGDQLTDVYGTHSGIKVMLPNQLFKSHIVPPVEDLRKCGPIQVREAQGPCAEALEPVVIEKSSLEYCTACRKKEGCAP